MDLRIHQLAAAVLLSLAGASALVLIDGASKKHSPEGNAAPIKAVADVRPMKAERQIAVGLAAQPPAAQSSVAQAAVAPQPMAQTASALPPPPAAAPAPAMRPPVAQPSSDWPSVDAGAKQHFAGVRSVRTETITPPSDRGIDLGATGNVGAASAFAATQNTPDPFGDTKAAALTAAKPPQNASDALTKAKVVAAAAPTSLQDAAGISNDTKATESQNAAKVADSLPACMPAPLQTALAAVEARFPGVKVVSTTHLNTDNHSHGSAREKMHLNCRAIDIKTSGNQRQVAAFLHTRPEVGGVEAYRNHVVHFDLNPNYAKAMQRVLARGRGSR
jgi:hypothetical protein